jgi:DNA-directed RNA polymerase specialized sigma24 family protein
MPRPNRRVDETDASRRLDDTVKRFDEVEDALRKLRAELQIAVVEAVRAGLSKAEAARRAGYSREYVSRLVAQADDDGATPDA